MTETDTTEARQTLEQFIRSHQLTMIHHRTRINPHMDSTDMDHWKVQIQAGKRVYTTYFSKGYGHKGAQRIARGEKD